MVPVASAKTKEPNSQSSALNPINPTLVNRTLQGEVAGGTYGYGHAVDELVEVLRDAVALELGGDGLRLGRGGTGSPSRLDVLALLLPSTEDDERWLDRACSSDARSIICKTKTSHFIALVCRHSTPSDATKQHQVKN